MVKLSERLAVIAGCIEQGETIADIGTDHGLLPIFLYENAICPKAILCDIKEGPLIKARENIERHIPGAPMDLRLGDGLAPLAAGECDCAVIAGMGGKLITSILQRNMEQASSFKKLILQPRNAQEKLREWLYRKGFSILDEHLAREGRYICEIIVAAKIPEVTTEEEREAGMMVMAQDLVFEISPLLLLKRDPLLPALIRQKMEIERDILIEIYRGGGGKRDRLPAVQSRLDQLKNLLENATAQISENPEIKNKTTKKAKRKQETEEDDMAISFSEFLAALRAIAPRELEEDWDNGGMQIEMSGGEVRKVLIALEITNAVIDEAVHLGVDYIVSHHPLIFNKIDVIDGSTVMGNYIIRLIQSGISVYSAHTSFDTVFGGNNDYLAELLDLRKVRRLKVQTAFGDEELIGRLGVFNPPKTLEEVAELIEEVLEIPSVKVVGAPQTMIETVGLCTGAGGSSLDGVLRNNCDLYITGDLKYHDAQAAKEMGLCVIDAGHYETEKSFPQNFGNKLKKATDGKIEIFESNINVDPFGL